MLDEKIQSELIAKGRAFTHGYLENDPYEELFESDQERKLPQPPLVKPAMRGEDARTPLPRDFEALEMKNDLLPLIRDRRSARIYTGGEMTLLQLSFLLWATQGVKKLRGRKYATLRTVPCGGARHEFETYLIVRRVAGLRPGAYHYLPMEHTLEYLHPIADPEQAITDSLCGQSWAAKANVVFYWSMVPYRAEWRYGIYAHRIALIDAGHIGQNLYLACTGLNLGTCAIGAFSDPICNTLFGLDGVEEYIVYTAPVGTVREQDTAEEAAFYSFVEDEGL
ncbi:MAG: SagB/ThcOx family dehydrogenase [Ruminococcaceae bacterium]|nr:SagB/ThcOx family dehydrogenase [Oscillospiraceae bacterium]